MSAPPPGAPRVTVVLITYNGAALIERALATALHQTYPSLEVVVVDDGSHDGTAELARAVSAGDTRVRVVTQPNGGPAGARNRGVREARGEYIAFLDHDDRWSAGKLEQQVLLLDRHPEAAVALCYSALVDEAGIELGWRLGGNAAGNVYGQMLEWDMVSGGSVVLARRSALVAAGGFDEELPLRSDWDLWIRLARAHPFVTVPETLVGYTRSPTGLSSLPDRMASAGEQVLAKAVTEDPSIDGRRYRFLRARDAFAVACFCLFDEQPREARRYLGRSLGITPAPVLRSPRRWHRRRRAAPLCAATPHLPGRARGRPATVLRPARRRALRAPALAIRCACRLLLRSQPRPASRPTVAFAITAARRGFSCSRRSEYSYQR